MKNKHSLLFFLVFTSIQSLAANISLKSTIKTQYLNTTSAVVMDDSTIVVRSFAGEKESLQFFASDGAEKKTVLMSNPSGYSTYQPPFLSFDKKTAILNTGGTLYFFDSSGSTIRAVEKTHIYSDGASFADGNLMLTRGGFTFISFFNYLGETIAQPKINDYSRPVASEDGQLVAILTRNSNTSHIDVSVFDSSGKIVTGFDVGRLNDGPIFDKNTFLVSDTTAEKIVKRYSLNGDFIRDYKIDTKATLRGVALPKVLSNRTLLIPSSNAIEVYFESGENTKVSLNDTCGTRFCGVVSSVDELSDGKIVATTTCGNVYLFSQGLKFESMTQFSAHNDCKTQDNRINATKLSGNGVVVSNPGQGLLIFGLN